MGDHEYFGSNVYISNEELIETEEISMEEKAGDAFLIKLYRARPFFYNKGHKDYKNKIVKDTDWNKISKIMQNKDYGNFYTPDYCQTRCTSLRNQYNREKRILESQYKSGSGPSSHKLFPFYNQLTFLDTYVRRRRTHNNIEVNKSLISSTLSAKVLSEISKSDPNEVLDNEKSNDSIYKEDNGEKNKENMLENTSRNVTHKRTITEKESYVLHTKPVKYKKSKVDETKECNDIFTSVSQKIISALDNKNKSNENEAFAEFIIAHLASLPQSQQNIRKRMITDALFSPLQEM